MGAYDWEDNPYNYDEDGVVDLKLDEEILRITKDFEIFDRMEDEYLLRAMGDYE